MKQKTLRLVLGIEAIICIAMAFMRYALAESATSIMAFPFAQIAALLRQLSLSGSVGNIISIILYIALSCIPLLVLLILRRRQHCIHPEDWLLVVLSAIHFVIMYYMINPGLVVLGSFGMSTVSPYSGALFGNIFYSVLVGYVVLRVLRSIYTADTGKTQKYLKCLLGIMNILFVYNVFGAHFAVLLASFEGLPDLVAFGQNPAINYVLIIFTYVLRALPYVLDIAVIFAAMALLDELDADRYSQQAVQSADRLALLCKRVLIIIVLLNVAYSIFILCFMKSLLSIYSTVQIPILSIALVLAALLLAQYIRENKKLKDDNDMFI